jgi:malonyl-CoA O-methyltransferase
MPDPVRLDPREGYDRWSEVYDDELNPLVILEEPVVRQWIGDPLGARIADVGCGTGRHALWLAEGGARVDAYDPSPGMMAKARRKLASHAVCFIEHSLPQALPVPDDTYDIVLFALVADHLPNLEVAFHELKRVTCPGGRLVFTVLHPSMNLLGITARFTDPHSGSEVRVAACEHTYADYVMAPLRAGWTIDDILERKADDTLAARTPRAQKYIGWPMLLAMHLRKAE